MDTKVKTLEERNDTEVVSKEDKSPRRKADISMPSWILANNRIIDEDGNPSNLEADHEAIRLYFTEHVNPNTIQFKTLQDKLDYMVNNEYWDKTWVNQYNYNQIKEVFKLIYAKHFQFKSYMAAFKFYNDYALKTNDHTKWLERYEDRLAVTALSFADGNFESAKAIAKSLINQDFVPATPSIMNAGRARRGGFTSCFMLNIGDSLEDITHAQEFASQLSKMGGGIGLNMSNIRARGESIKGVEGASSGIVGWAKIFDNILRTVNQLGQRQGAGVVYLNIFHADVEEFLGMKKINADEDVRAKTLSLGLVVPDKFMELARDNKPMYIFYPHNIKEIYNEDFDDIGVNMDKWYDRLVANPKVKKKEINPRKLLDLIASVQGQSGYPYMMYVDNVNAVNTNELPVKFSNLCSEILQPNTLSKFHSYNFRDQDEVGIDVACNLASVNIAGIMEHDSMEETVGSAMTIMNYASEHLDVDGAVPSVEKGNNLMHAVGLGAMNLHGFLAKNYIPYGSEESLEFVDVFFNALNYYSLLWSMYKAKETGKTFFNFDKSTYADGSYFEGRGAIYPKSDEVKEVFKDMYIPTDEDWLELKQNVMKYGVYNAYRHAIAPNGRPGA